MKPTDKWKRLKKKRSLNTFTYMAATESVKKTQKFIILKWNNCNGIWAKTKFTKTVCFNTQNDIFHSNFNPVSYLEAFNNSQDHPIKSVTCMWYYQCLRLFSSSINTHNFFAIMLTSLLKSDIKLFKKRTFFQRFKQPFPMTN